MGLPFDLGIGAFAILALGLFVASFARGYSGFGFSALLVASGSLVTDPINVVPLAIVMEVSASVLQAASVWRHVDWKRVGLLCGGALIGNPVGVALLAYLSSNSLRIAISAFILAASAVLLSGWRRTRRTGAAGAGLVGLGSGVVNGATALGGLPVALFLTADRQDPATMRATLVAFFFLTDFYAGVLFVHEGVLNRATVEAAVWALPILVVGLVLGGRHFIGTTPEAFRRFTLGLLIALSLTGLVKATML
ncbi:MAG: sulfite exporter TauE/SafE family protein [Hyphomicrobiales bacterium]